MLSRLARLCQPRNPKFWMMAGLNGLSTALAWITHHVELSWPAATLVVVFAIGNAVLGVALMLDLMKTPPPDQT